MTNQTKFANDLCDRLANNQIKALHYCQKQFAKRCVKNAKLISCPLPVSIMGCGNDNLDQMLASVSSNAAAGSEVLFDYYPPLSVADVTHLLSKHGYLLYEHLNSSQIKQEFFGANSQHQIPYFVSFCLAVKKEHLSDNCS